MPLPPIAPDREPTDVELAAEIAALRPRWTGDEKLLREFACLQWRAKAAEVDPNSFLVPFADSVPYYQSYLDSEEWKRIRSQLLRAANKECAGCEKGATQVHHRDYRPRVLRGGDLAALVPLCGDCYNKVDKIRGKRRDDWNEKERILARLVEVKESCRTIAAANPKTK